MADMAEIVIVISAVDIEKNKVRGDLGITYDVDVLRLIEEYENKGLYVGSIVITHYEGRAAPSSLRKRWRRKISGFIFTTPLRDTRPIFP